MTRRLILLAGAAALRDSSRAQFQSDRLANAMNRFSEEYNAFAEKLSVGVFDAQQARRLSRLWREVENCGVWPGSKAA